MVKKLVSIIAVLLIATVAWLFVFSSNSQPQLLSTQGMAIEGLPNVPTHAIALLDSQHMTRSSGHPHIPGGVVGEDRYLFDGKIEINGTRYSLRSEGHRPIAAVEVNSYLYVVAQGFFRWDKNGFLVFVQNPQYRFELFPLNQLPREMWRLRFKDDDQTCTYRTWLLRELSGQVSHAAAIECFETLFRLNPRFGFLEKWRSDETTSFGEDVGRFLQKVIVPNCAMSTLPDIVAMLNLTKATDDPHLIAVLCETIVKMDPARGSELICNFKSSIPDLSNQKDARAYVFTGIPFFQELACAATSQPVKNVRP